ELGRRGLLFRRGDDLDLAVVLLGDRPDRIVGEGLREGGHLAHHHQFLDQVSRAEAEQLREISDSYARADLRRLRLGRIGLYRCGLFEQRTTASATAAARRSLRWRTSARLTPGSLGVDDHPAALLAPTLPTGRPAGPHRATGGRGLAAA